MREAGSALADLDENTPENRPKVTIVVANYNHGRFLPRCFDAILRQTRPADEVIVIDDASTDDSLSVIVRFASSLPGFRLIRRDVNRGVVAAMNEGLEKARGTHVLFAAADDWIEPDLLELSVNMLTQFPAAGLCSGLTRLANDEGETLGPFRTQLPLLSRGYISPVSARRKLIADDGWFNGNTVIMNRKAALDAGGYRPELGSFCDMFLNSTLALRHGACFIPHFLGVWRRMNSGYSASLLANPAALMETLTVGQQLMSTPSVAFPAEFVQRWTARSRFTLARQVVKLESSDRRAMLAEVLPPRWRRLAGMIAGTARIPVVGPRASASFLFLLLRSADTWPVLRRHVVWFWMAKAFGGNTR